MKTEISKDNWKEWVEKALKDPSTRFVVKDMLIDNLKRDPVDASHDTAFVAAIFQARMEDSLRKEDLTDDFAEWLRSKGRDVYDRHGIIIEKARH